MSKPSNTFQRRVLEHQPSFDAVGEANRHYAARVDACDDAFSERSVSNIVARREVGYISPRRDRPGSVAGP